VERGDRTVKFDIGRIQVFESGDRPIQVKMGGDLVIESGRDSTVVRRHEVVAQLALGRDDRKLVQSIRVGRDDGGVVFSELDAAALETLAGAISVTAKPGLYELEKRHVVGRFLGEEIAVEVADPQEPE
jgi:hypothetical protein